MQAWGAWLRDDQGRYFLDCHAQQGEAALGHHAPAVRRAVEQALHEGLPAMVQLGRGPYAEQLAEELVRHTGTQRCLFTSSNEAAIATAIALARARTGRSLILIATGAPTGRSGADSLPPVTPCSPVPFGDCASLAAHLQRESGRVAALLASPICIDGGIIVPPPGYLRAVRELCDAHRVLLILDEMQTGLGRTGGILAAAAEGVRADIIVLGAGLGGGLFPLRALLCRAEVWDDDFAHRSGPAWAVHNVAGRVGLTVLRELLDGGLCRDALANGRYLSGKLESLRLRFPSVVSAVRGRGLLHAIELQPGGEEQGFVFSYLASQGLLPYVAAAAAAERGSVLFQPSPGSNVLRLTPPLIVTREELDQAVCALAEVCQLLSAFDSAELLRAIGATHPRHLQTATPRPPQVSLPRPAIATRPTSPAFAFLWHYSDRRDVVHNDPGLAALSEEELAAFTGFAAALPAGLVLHRKRVRSATGAEADALILALPLLPEQLPRIGPSRLGAEIERAVDLAARLGAQVVGLGGLTPHYSRQGLAVAGRGPAITTGSTLTAVMAVRAVQSLRGSDWQKTRVAVVGADSAIGGLCARLIARERPEHLLLIGTAGSKERPLLSLAAELVPLCGEVVATGGVTALAGHDVVITTAGAAGAIGEVPPLLDNAPLSPGTLVCDLARPQEAPWHLRARRDVTVIDGGLVALPDRLLRLGPGNLHGLPAGVQLPSLAETMLLALAGVRTDTGLGQNIALSTADYIAALADVHGFSLAEPPRHAQQALQTAERRPRVHGKKMSKRRIPVQNQHLP